MKWIYLMNLMMIWFSMTFYFWDKFFFLLISMEGLMTTLFMLTFSSQSSTLFSFEMVFLFLSMMIIEGTVGLTVAVKMVFKSSNDKFFMSSFF